MSVVLVDMDGVLADIEVEFERQLRELHGLPTIALEDRRGFWIDRHYAKVFPDQAELYREHIDAALFRRGFFRSLQPIPGATEGINKLQEAGHLVRICTAPMVENEWCAYEKYNWVKRFLGEEWCRKVIIAKDKTYIVGDYLIDDKSPIVGDLTPTWRHVLYDGHTNKETAHDTLFRFTWDQQDHWLYQRYGAPHTDGKHSPRSP